MSKKPNTKNNVDNNDDTISQYTTATNDSSNGDDCNCGNQNGTCPSACSTGLDTCDISALIDSIVPGKSTEDERTGPVPSIAPGIGAHAEGCATQALGNCSHAEGAATRAIGKASHAEGLATKAIGIASHAEGDPTTAYGYASHAEGINTYAGASGSHSEGLNTSTTGLAAHSEGVGTTGSGNYSHAEG